MNESAPWEHGLKQATDEWNQVKPLVLSRDCYLVQYDFGRHFLQSGEIGHGRIDIFQKVELLVDNKVPQLDQTINFNLFGSFIFLLHFWLASSLGLDLGSLNFLLL